MCILLVEECHSNISFQAVLKLARFSYSHLSCERKENLQQPNGLFNDCKAETSCFCVCGFFYPASPDAVHPSCLSISLPGNTIRELMRTISTQRDLPHMNAYSTPSTQSRCHPSSFCQTLQLQWSSLSVSVFYYSLLWRSISFLFSLRCAEAWGKQLDSAGCCRGKAAKKTDKSERPNCFLMCSAAWQEGWLRDCERVCLFMCFFSLCLIHVYQREVVWDRMLVVCRHAGNGIRSVCYLCMLW